MDTKRAPRLAVEATYGQVRNVQGGRDDRTLVSETSHYPWRSLTLLEITGPDGEPYIGTGWFLGPRLIATAGHCVFFQGAGNTGPVQSVTVKPGGRSSPFPRFDAKRVSAHPNWENGGSQASDYGVVLLDEPVGDQVGTLGFGQVSDSQLQGLSVISAGYPLLRPPIEPPFPSADGTLWRANGRVTKVDPGFIFHDIDTEGGQSGSPIFYIQGGLAWAIGIHHFGDLNENRGIRIGPDVLTFFQFWLQQV